jgi:hypothetical protein
VSGSSSALMQAALGSVDLPSGVSEALSSLEMLSNIDKNPVLPNGTVFQKTHVKHPRTHQTGAMSSTSGGSATGQLRSTTAPGGSVRSSTAAAAATMQVRPTMVAPRTRVSTAFTAIDINATRRRNVLQVMDSLAAESFP